MSFLPINMFKTGTVTSYDKDAGRGIITDETGEEYVILANNIVKTHTTQFLEKDDSVKFIPYYGDPSMQQAGIAQPLIGIDNNKPNNHEVYFILECYFHGEGKHEIERIKCLVAPTTDKIMFPDVFKAKSAYEFMQCPEQSFFVDTLSGKHEIERIKCLVAPTTDKIMFPDVFKAKSAYEFMQCPEQSFFVDTLSDIKSAYEFMQCPEQSFFVDTLSDILKLNVVNALSQMSKIPKDTIEDNLHIIIDEFSISAADIKTNIIYWTVTGSFKQNGEIHYKVFGTEE